jgi:hypothetical protein
MWYACTFPESEGLLARIRFRTAKLALDNWKLSNIFCVLRKDKGRVTVKCPDINKTFVFQWSAKVWIKHSQTMVKKEHFSASIGYAVIFMSFSGLDDQGE